ncbi:HlyD family secretion protein [Geosporobacter ferrireducens]|uniref:RND transporter n=1 Tax=Geosporobacter ferrireducens TaxID=1424294 RepID=A0A1D8GEN0_9FIRM|nr:HlyD family efflux transporter periplasmic adaptor subunit [Geosporobacter ferrireducens]AOT69367.1 RND transporter [Geosporobacter ferrireducens]MTI57055.1 HlyD family efflux transporter periplasmic adaptor subunit [Geosporobacter ferrireducens]
MEKIKRPKKMMVIGSIVLVIAILLTVSVFSAGRDRSTFVTGYTELSRNELVNSISVSGTVESYHAQNVYSTLNYPVKEINVSVGDSVKSGDILAKLDTASLELDIAQQRSTLENSQKTAAIDLDNKRRTYENTRSQHENGLNAELINAENSLKTAESDLQTKQTTYENNKSLFASGFVSQQELDQSETNYKLAVSNYEKAAATLKTTKLKLEQDLKTAEANFKSAEANYKNDSQRIALQKLEKNLADSAIKAPVDGTVTAVYAVVGSPGNGLLFVIEDTESLMVTTYVKEYDAGKVHPGQQVTIKSDATGNRILNGEVVKISPASAKNAAGATISSSTVEFETEVAILDYDPKLKIGMNTRINIILEKKDSVYAVPYDAVTVNSDGQNIVYVIADENGKKIVKEQIIEKGMETDLYTEISGDGLADGVIVVNDTASVKPGDVIHLQTAGK